MSAAEYQQMVSAAGGNPRRVRVPDGAHTWPTLSIGVALDDARIRRPVVNPACWCTPVACAVRGSTGDVVLVLSAQDTQVAPGATHSDGRWQMLTVWTPEQARLLAAQLLAATRDK
jgi:hypothetical protein